MRQWVLVAILALQAHFAASYLVPLDSEAQHALAGLLRWFWPWSYGDHGPPGTITVETGLPFPGLILAMTAATLLVLAALAAAGIWIPSGWWRGLAAVGAALLMVLMALFFGPTKVIPLTFALVTLYVALANHALPGAT